MNATHSETQPYIGHAYTAYRVDQSRHECTVIYRGFEGGMAILQATDGKTYHGRRLSDDHCAPIFEFNVKDNVK